MELATIATGAATAWLADKAAQSVGVDLGQVAKKAVNEVIDTATTIARLPANINIGRIINTVA